jgi:hypothetical protein
MRTVLFFVGSTLGSIAFQVSVALYPQALQQYAWLVKWLWIAWAVIWITWLLLHPKLLGFPLGGKTQEKMEKPETKGRFLIEDSFNPNFTQIGSPVHLHVGDINREEARKPLPPIEKPKPNIVSLGPPRVIDVDPASGNFHEVDHAAPAIALRACFRNEISTERTDDAGCATSRFLRSGPPPRRRDRLFRRRPTQNQLTSRTIIRLSK